MLISKNKKSQRRFGNQDTLVYLVPEFCIMTGITDAMRLIYVYILILIINFVLIDTYFKIIEITSL